VSASPAQPVSDRMTDNNHTAGCDKGLNYQTSPESELVTSRIVAENLERLEKCARIGAVHASETRVGARARN
jgi:hypothetical protein